MRRELSLKEDSNLIAVEINKDLINVRKKNSCNYDISSR